MKRSYSGSDQYTSPFKKRPFLQQITPSTQPQPSSADHTGLLNMIISFFLQYYFNIDEDDDDDDDEGDSLNMNASGNVMEKNSGTKRDDSRRRAAHTAAEQKRRNAIRVI